MEQHNEIKTALGIALLFTIITSIFALPNKLSALQITNDGFITSIDRFININLLWIIVVAIIIILLIIYFKKTNQNIHLEVFQNQHVCLVTGVLVSLQGLVTFAGVFPTYIMSIQTAFKMTNLDGNSIAIAMVRNTIIIDIVSMIAIICQIIFGVYLVMHNRKNIK